MFNNNDYVMRNQINYWNEDCNMKQEVGNFFKKLSKKKNSVQIPINCTDYKIFVNKEWERGGCGMNHKPPKPYKPNDIKNPKHPAHSYYLNLLENHKNGYSNCLPEPELIIDNNSEQKYCNKNRYKTKFIKRNIYNNTNCSNCYNNFNNDEDEDEDEDDCDDCDDCDDLEGFKNYKKKNKRKVTTIEIPYEYRNNVQCIYNPNLNNNSCNNQNIPHTQSTNQPNFQQNTNQPNYQQPNYQQPNYQYPTNQPNYQQPNYQQPNYQQPNYQQPNYQPNYQQPNYQSYQNNKCDCSQNTNLIDQAINNIKTNTHKVNEIGRHQLQQTQNTINKIKDFQKHLNVNYRGLTDNINKSLTPLLKNGVNKICEENCKIENNNYHNLIKSHINQDINNNLYNNICNSQQQTNNLHNDLCNIQNTSSSSFDNNINNVNHLRHMYYNNNDNNMGSSNNLCGC